MMLEGIGQIELLEIRDNADGSANLIFEISDDVKKKLTKYMGWPRWSKKRFDVMINEAIRTQLNKLEKEVSSG